MEEGRIKNFVKGVSSEKIFEMLHEEMGCLVFTTGQESIYPNLFRIAKRYRDYTFLSKFQKGVNELGSSTETEAKLKALRLMTRKSEGVEDMSSSPDFTIISPSGHIHTFEVKFRKNGELSEKDYSKYLKRNEPPKIFLLFPFPPYIDIYVPQGEIKHKAVEVMESILKEGEDFRDITPNEFNNRLKTSRTKEEYHKVWKELEEESDNGNEEMVGYFQLPRKLTKTGRNGDLVVVGVFEHEFLVYTKELTDKYGKIVEEFFKEDDNLRRKNIERYQEKIKEMEGDRK